MERIRRLDVFREVPRDLTEPTVAGAAATVVAAVVAMMLLISEVSAFMAVKTESRTFVDVANDAHGVGESLDVRINLTFPRLPCILVSVDYEDVMGSVSVDMESSIEKTRLDQHGGRVASAGLQRNEEELENEANLLKQLGEGCNIVGVLTIKKVPGNFHISTHAHSDLMKKVIKKEDLNLSHVIHHLSFGPAVDVHGVDAAFAPLNGMRRIISQEVQAPLPSFEYYIKMVPTIYEQLNGDVVRTHQFTSNSNMVFYTHPVVFFRFDISPITVKFTDTRQPFLHFVVQLCAIVGGVVTVLGMSSRILHRSISSVLAKARYGKLG